MLISLSLKDGNIGLKKNQFITESSNSKLFSRPGSVWPPPPWKHRLKAAVVKCGSGLWLWVGCCDRTRDLRTALPSRHNNYGI